MDALKENQVLAPFGPDAPFRKKVRVVRIEPKANRVWLCILGSKRIPRAYDFARIKRNLESQELIEVEDRPAARVPAYDDAPEGSRAICDEAWIRLQPIRDDVDAFFDERKRAALMRSAAKEAGVDLATLYRTVARYFENGQSKLALMPRYQCPNARQNQPEGQRRRGRPPREAPPPGEQAFVFTDDSREAVIDFLMNSERFATFEAAYGAVTYRLFTEEVDGESRLLPLHRVPTRSQLRHLIKQIDRGFAFTKRQIGNEFQLKLRPLAGGARDLAFSPGFEYQIDWTGTQVELVSAFDRNKVVGRPSLYFVVDMKTGVIAGFHVTLESASWDTARFALVHAFSPKAEYCRRLGLDYVEADWPISGVPARLVGDRGELIGMQSMRVVEETLGCELVNARAYRGDDKPYVERTFGSIKTALLKQLKGYGPKRRNRDGEPNPRSRACLNLFEFNRLIARFCVTWNSKRLARDSIPDAILGDSSARATPLGLWNWGLRNQGGKLRAIDRNVLYRHLLPQVDAKMYGDGIHFRGGVYRSNELRPLGMQSRARRDGASSVKVHFDSARPDHIWLWLPGTRDLIECPRADVSGDRARWSFEDAELAVGVKSAKRRAEATATERGRTELDHERMKVEDFAMREKRSSTTPTSMTAQRVRANRRSEACLDAKTARINNGVLTPPKTARAASRRAVPPRRNKLHEKFLRAFPSS